MGMVRDRREINPILIKLGVVLTLSFAGYLYSQFRNRIHANSSSGNKSRVDDGKGKSGGTGPKDEARVLQSPTDHAPSTLENEETPPRIDITVGFSPKIKNSVNEEGMLLPEFNDLVLPENSFCWGISQMRDGGDPPIQRTDKEEMGLDQEILNLRNTVRILRERERNLEIQLLEYYGVKEQETAVRELQNCLKINTVESKLFNLKIQSLQAENRRLEAQLSDHLRVMAELESARAKIKQLKKKIRSDNEQAKDQLAALLQRVRTLQDQEASMNDAEVQEALQRFKDLERESMELRRANVILQHKNSELEMKLESTQLLASVLQDPEEAEAMEKAIEEANQLRQANEDLERELDRLQSGRYADVEELVYLRWINACLRYELRNYQAPPGKTAARDLNKRTSPKSEMKAKQLILEYASNLGGINGNSDGLVDFDSEYCCSSSQTSTLTETTGEFDDSSMDFPSSNARNRAGLSKTKVFSKLKRLLMGKESKDSRNRSQYLVRNTTNCGHSGKRGSISMGSLDDMMGTRYSYEDGSSCITAASSASLSATKLFHDPSILAMQVEGELIIPHDEIVGSKCSQEQKKNLYSQRMSRSCSLDEIQKRSELCRDLTMDGRAAMRLPRGDQQLVDHGGPIAPEKLELLKYADALKRSREMSKETVTQHSVHFDV